MATNRRAEWTEGDYETLRQMLATGDGFPAIARAMRRVQTDVASKAFALKWEVIG